MPCVSSKKPGFQVPVQHFSCYWLLMRVDGLLSQYYNAMTTTVVLQHQRVNPRLFAWQIGHMKGTISSSTALVCIFYTYSLNYYNVWKQITYQL